MHFLGVSLFKFCYGVGKGVARYHLHFNAPQVIFVLGGGSLARGQSPIYQLIFYRKKVINNTYPFFNTFFNTFFN